MKKKVVKILSLLLSLVLLAGCSGGGGSSDLSAQQANSDTLLSNEKISYVIIYNPDLYDETKSYNDLLNTGDFAESVEAIINKADGIQEIPQFIPVTPESLIGDMDVTQFDLDGSRGGAFITPYQVGDTHSFYYGSDTRKKGIFTCRYAGESCNIWTCDSSVSNEQAELLGKEFDNNIYDSTTEFFGTSRFYSNGGKVNILSYAMEPSLGGFFYLYDLFASDEVTENDITTYGINTDHDVININSLLLDDAPEYVFSTMAHEFQHLICFTGTFETANFAIMKTWLNESMSGYIEEELYPGTKELSGHYDAFVSSSRIRHGQSMYNFETTTTNMEFDIGVYGSVYLFSEYLSSIGGEEIFRNIHSYWRDSYSPTLNEAEAIVNSISASKYDEINSMYNFDGLTFNNECDEWLSKLTLNFYLSLLHVDSNSPDAYKKVEAQTLLYDEINPADIEGGGRVIVALKDGEFKFPEDADEGLVYIGLNSNFEVITDCVIR